LLGTFVQVRDPAACEVAAASGLDVLCIEAEHSGMGVETVERLVAAVQATTAAALVRLAGNDPILIAAALDAGADGVIVPRVSSSGEVRAAVAAARYPPAGQRGLGPSRATAYGAEIVGYLSRANQDLLLALQVETREAVERLEELLEPEEVDLVFVGPGDLACSLGVEPGSGELAKTIESILSRAREAGRMTGIFAATATDAKHWRAAGVNLVLLGSDLGWLAAGLAGAVTEVRRANSE
jgi:4-hydroxy-2-oxoheptanedioate aldolase